jgi:hypothetical protein
MFAVIVLGIGFIMVAAVFPVAIQQSAATSEETTGASIARGAVNYLQTIATNITMPSTSTGTAIRASVVNFSNVPAGTSGWEALRGNLILPDNPRFAWVALYRREFNAPSAQVIVIPVQCRNRSSYISDDTSGLEIDTTPDVTGAPPAAQANLYARDVEFTITNDGVGTGIDTIVFTAGEVEAVAEGCYVIVGQDALGAPDTGYFNGRIYRVGALRNDLPPNTYELSAGNDFTPEDPGSGLVTDLTDATGFVVGKEVVDPAGKTYEGPAQDVGIYTTFIQVR